MPQDDSGFGNVPIDAKYLERMNRLAKYLDSQFNGLSKGPNRKVGFVLLCFPFNNDPGGRTNYISNGADRADVARLFEEQIYRLRNNTDDDTILLAYMAAKIGQALGETDSDMLLLLAKVAMLAYREGVTHQA
jgi:hypothetical protein